MNISPQECHTVQSILDTHVILDEEVKYDIVMQEEDNSIKNDNLTTNMTANVNVDEVRVQKSSLDESEEGTNLFNLILGQKFRENYFNSYKADKKGVSIDITKEDNTLTEEQIMIQNERHIDAQEQKLDSYTGGRNSVLLGSLSLPKSVILFKISWIHM